MRHAWVSGASGFVGINVVRKLVTDGWQVSAFCRPSAKLDPISDLPVTRIDGDLTDARSIQQSLSADIDTVFHIAADTSVWARHNARQTAINVGGTRHVVDAVLRQGIRRMVYTSSFATWGFQDTVFNETTPPNTDSYWINYTKSKAAARDVVLKAVAQQNLPAVIVCPGHIIGPYDRHNWARLFIMLAQGKLPGVPPGSGAFADVREIAKAQIKAADADVTGEQFLLGGQAISYLELLQQAAVLLQVKPPQKANPAWAIRLLARLGQLIGHFSGKEPRITPEGAAMITHHMHCDSSKAENQLGYRQTPIDELLKDTIGWLRTAGLV